MVKKRTECAGEEVNLGRHYELYQCADSCRNISSMFIFGTKEFGFAKGTIWERCGEGGCECRCETGATIDGNCPKKDHDGYNLYTFKKTPYSK